MSKESSHSNKPNHIVDTLAIISLSLFIFIFWKSSLFGISFFELTNSFKEILNFPHYNGPGTRKIININALVLFYEFLFLTLCVAITHFTFFTDLKTKKHNPTLTQIVTTIGIIGLLFLTGIQQIYRFEHFISEKNKLSGKSTDEKIASLFGWKYQFPKICQTLLRKPCQGSLITDFDLSKDPHLFTQHLMSYHLYPKISMRFDNQSPADCLIVYSNKNILDQVPENYKVILTAVNSNYILAIREKEKNNVIYF